ncbi:SagB/ThcOx family dehydrogenase [Dethiobacter alkaliphilus]|uniref:Nitroreductase n=1 Tax=Dethiobacter alkaliphilus AHT 1 TaxID=555088 RepID=C0GIC5_DETAL|nr:SagB/ThcOx family dehydrogenase [Dethiobacter alkaliphilus]EEG76973.1 nitroreductase [Dethiobacter alkaliphilus AHT 1]
MRIGDEFQNQTKYFRDSSPAMAANEKVMPPYKEYPADHPRITLPEPMREGGKPLFTLCSKRRSVRRYQQEEVTLASLGQILWAAQGVTLNTGRHLFRTVPSAGALYPLETYVLANKVDGLAKGIYHYEVPGHRLTEVTSGDFGPALTHAALGQKMVQQASCTLIWSMIAARAKRKYSQRAYRYIYMDAGHSAQNVALAAVSLGLGSCQIAAFFDQEVNDLLGLDGQDETAIYLTAVGIPAG